MDAERSLDVRLCALPFAPLVPPSLALGLLKAGLVRRGLRVEVCHCSIWLAESMGLEGYQTLSGRLLRYGVHELGQWIFAGALFPDSPADPDAYVEQILRRTNGHYRPEPLPEELIELACHLRAGIDATLDDWAARVLAGHPALVGFTCSYYQRIPSLALARRVKQRAAETTVVLGGPDCEGIMGVEIARQFPFVDAVVSGPGDTVLPDLAARVLGGRSYDALPGVTTHSSAALAGPTGACGNAPGPTKLDELPFPDYDDYFRELEQSGLELSARPWISVETARGCWWGQRAERCTFCAENLREIAFRSKTPARALTELRHLAERYRPSLINVVDRVLAPRHLHELMPELARDPLPAPMLVSVRPTLDKHELGLLAAAGVATVGIGIESLSTPVLGLMHKGVTMLENLQILKWTQELGLQVLWNMLWGLPGEPTEAYARVAELIPRITHLVPPKIATPVVLMRYSPLFDRSSDFGLAEVEPAEVYSHLYPIERKAVVNLAYYFHYRYDPPRDVAGYTRPVLAAVEHWQRVHSRASLRWQTNGGPVEIHDGRPGAPELVYLPGELECELLRQCDRVRSLAELVDAVGPALGEELAEEQILATLSGLRARWLMVNEGERWLSLVVGTPP